MATPTYTPLGTITLSSTDSEIVFSSIPATYRDLVLVAVGRNSPENYIGLRFNSDTGNNYSWVRMLGPLNSGAGTASDVFSAYFDTTPCDAVWQIMDYSATDKHKTVLLRTNYRFSNGANSEVGAAASRWANNNAINTVTVRSASGSMQVGFQLSLYGIH